jgi:two-component system chemotaxis sensor kinase CheA
MNVASLNASFLQEAEDLLTQIEDCALNLEDQEDKQEGINQLFRAFHTIKGTGGMFGFQTVASFTHHLETVLDDVRAGKLPLSRRLLDLILLAKDHIKQLVDGKENDARGNEIVNSLNELSGRAPLAQKTPVLDAPTVTEPKAGISQTWHIQFRPNSQIMLSGTDPQMLFRSLAELGPLSCTTHTDAIPELDVIDPCQCYCGWDIELVTAETYEEIRSVFMFVEDDSDIKIEQLNAPSAPSLPAPEAPAALLASSATRTDSAETSQRTATIRVPADKLDRLVSLVGELVMNESRLLQVSARIKSQELDVPVEEIDRLTSELRECILGIRMMPIGSTFGRLKRLVRDLSGELGKEIELITEGAQTELDKTVLDQLGDPLVHLIRNSIDHGIENASDRVAAGKPAQGTISLRALHNGSSVVVSIHDDGKGLNPATIKAKAIEKKLIPPDSTLTDKEIYRLIFLPGFSTAAKVTNISGRGVGMDVVKRQIESLRGVIDIRSQVGKGTTISLTLPLTLAIIDGLLVDVGGQHFIIPMSLVLENTELPPGERNRNNGRRAIAVRGELVPYICLREEFDLAGAPPPHEKIVVVRHQDERLGLVVDRVLGSHQTVIQALGKMYSNIEVVSGSTVMGDGRVALILDVPGLVHLSTKHLRLSAA